MNLRTFLRAHDINAHELELLAIIRRIDTDGDARLDFNEFADFLKASAATVAVAAPRTLRGLSPLRGPVARGQPPPFMPPPLPPSATVFQGPPATFGATEPKKPILRVGDEDELINSLREQCSLEREIEACKIALSQKCDFNLFDAFNVFDVARIGQISVHDIREGLNAIGVHPTAEEVELFVTRYDRTHDRRLTFPEFSEAFLPLDQYFCTMLNRRPANRPGKAVYKRDDCFLADTQVEFRSMWRTHFSAECASETLRQRLQSRPFFNLADAFNSLDINEDGRVTFDELKRLIESRGFFVDARDLTQVLDKMDTDGQGSVSYAQFREEMMPKSPNRRA